MTVVREFTVDGKKHALVSEGDPSLFDADRELPGPQPFPANLRLLTVVMQFIRSGICAAFVLFVPALVTGTTRSRLRPP